MIPADEGLAFSVQRIPTTLNAGRNSLNLSMRLILPSIVSELTLQTNTRTRAQPPRKAAGFTLLELLVVLALAALMVTVAGIGGNAFLERARYQQTVRDVSSELRQARMRSIDGDEAVLVRWQQRDRQLQAGDTTLQIPDTVDVRWQALDTTHGQTDAAPVIFAFDPDGGARGGRFAVLRAGRGVSFQVNWLLGRVEQSAVEVAG